MTFETDPLGRRTRACCTRRGKKEWRSFAILYFCHEFIMAADIRPDCCKPADRGRLRQGGLGAAETPSANCPTSTTCCS